MDPGSGSLGADIFFKLLVITISAYLSAIYSGSEVAILSLNRIRLLELSEQGDKRAKILLKILEKPGEIVSSLLVANTTVNVVMVVVWTSILLTITEHANLPVRFIFKPLNLSISTHGLIITIGGLLLTGFIITVCENLPKNLFHRDAENQALSRAGFLKATIVVTKPLLWLVYNVSSLILRFFGITLKNAAAPVTEEEIIDLIETGKEEGLIQEQEREMIHSIFEFGDLKVKDVMIPRVDMHALNIKTPLSEALRMIVDTGHSRLPVYGKTRDDVLGLLYAKDVLSKLGQKDYEKITLEKLYRDIEFVPEEMLLSNLFNQMKLKKTHLAVVVDEYGGTAGIVTIEDVLEELVGEIEDEYDKNRLLSRGSGDTWVVDGKLNLHDLEDLTEVEIPSDAADTVGGLILHKLGRMPVEGDEISVGNLLFKVISVKSRRVKEIEVRKSQLEIADDLDLGDRE